MKGVELKKLRINKFGVLMSVLVLAAILPVMIVTVVSGSPLSLITQADEPERLRVWFEPQTVVMSPGERMVLKVIARCDDPTKLIPQVVADVATNNSNVAQVVGQNLDYRQVFSGQVEVGTVEVEAMEVGRAKIVIPDTSVNTTLANFPIVSSGVDIIVQ